MRNKSNPLKAVKTSQLPYKHEWCFSGGHLRHVKGKWRDDDGRTIDAVEVVRCKDCKWWNTSGCAILIVDDSDRPDRMDFCSFGERRKNDE